MEEKNHPFPGSPGGGLRPDVQGSPRPARAPVLRKQDVPAIYFYLVLA